MIRKPSPVLSLLVILLVSTSGFAQQPGVGKKRLALALLFGGSAFSIYGGFAKEVVTSELKTVGISYSPSKRISLCFPLQPNCDLPTSKSELVTVTHRKPNWIIVGSGAGAATAGVFLFRSGSKKARGTKVVLGPQRFELNWAW